MTLLTRQGHCLHGGGGSLQFSQTPYNSHFAKNWWGLGMGWTPGSHLGFYPRPASVSPKTVSTGGGSVVSIQSPRFRSNPLFWEPGPPLLLNPSKEERLWQVEGGSGNSNPSEVGQFCYWLGFSPNHAEGLITSKFSHPPPFFFFFGQAVGLAGS